MPQAKEAIDYSCPFSDDEITEFQHKVIRILDCPSPNRNSKLFEFLTVCRKFEYIRDEVTLLRLYNVAESTLAHGKNDYMLKTTVAINARRRIFEQCANHLPESLLPEEKLAKSYRSFLGVLDVSDLQAKTLNQTIKAVHAPVLLLPKCIDEAIKIAKADSRMPEDKEAKHRLCLYSQLFNVVADRLAHHENKGSEAYRKALHYNLKDIIDASCDIVPRHISNTNDLGFFWMNLRAHSNLYLGGYASGELRFHAGLALLKDKKNWPSYCGRTVTQSRLAIRLHKAIPNKILPRTFQHA